jgi:hypothetical protein
MAGYAYPVGATTTEYPSQTITVGISNADPIKSTLFTATKKTRVNSVLVTNNSFGILPVRLYVNQGGGDKLIARTRVTNTNYLVAPLVSGDPRTSNFEGETLTEFTLQVGDVLSASCPFAGKIEVTVNLSEGVK